MGFTGQLGTQGSKPGQMKLAIVSKDTAHVQASKSGLTIQVELIANPIFTLQSSPDLSNAMKGEITLTQTAGFWIEQSYPFTGMCGHEWAELGNFVLGLGPQNLTSLFTLATTAGWSFTYFFNIQENFNFTVNSQFIFVPDVLKDANIAIRGITTFANIGYFYINQYPSNFFQLNQTIEEHIVPKPVFNTLTFTQTVTAVKIDLISVANILAFKQTVQTIANLSVTVSNTYRPFNGSMLNVGGGILVINQPPVTGTISTPRFVRIFVPNRLILLPAPLLGDSQQTLKTMKIGRSLNAVKYTYLKKTNLQHLSYTFRLGRVKSLELRDFILNFADRLWTMVNWKGETWKVNIMNDPVELIGKNRYVGEREEIDIMLEFEGIKIT